MKCFIFSVFALLTTGIQSAAAASVYDFTVTDIEGKEVKLSDYKGKVLLIVNTASKCGFTRQYADLVKLQDTYGPKGVVVLGFPANNFRNQEPGTNEEIAAFCSDRFSVDFPLFGKVSVKGEDQHPLFAYLTTAANPDFVGEIKWNFEKFVIGPDGTLAHRFRSRTNPNGDEVHKALDALVPATTP